MKNLEKEIDNSIERIEKREKDITTESKNLEKKISNYNWWAWFFVVIGGIIGISATSIFFYIKGFCFCDFELNLLGDFLAGSMGAVWSLAGLFFIYVAFLGQKQQLLNQQLEIMYNQLEVKYTRLELNGQKQEMKTQNETLKLQKFEHTFFSLLNLLNTIIDSINIRNERSKDRVIVSSGRDCFNFFYNELTNIVNKYNEDEIIKIQNIELNTLLNSYKQTYTENTSDAKNFRKLYEELSVTFEKSNENLRNGETKDLLKSYENIYKEKTESIFNKFYGELVSIFNKQRNTSIETIEIIPLIKCYEKLYIENQANLGHYFRSIYHIIKFIDKADINDKKHYIGLLRAQLSSYEQVIIFYNCLHSYGEKFKALAEKYTLFKSIDVHLFINPNHKEEIKNSAYEYENTATT